MKTAVIIVAFNNADLIIKQAQCIDRFLKNDRDVFIIDNSTVPEAIAAVRYHAHRLGCTYIRHDNTIPSPSLSHAAACNFAYQFINKDAYRYFILLDHDNFLVKPLDISELLGNNIMAGMLQTRNDTHYFWPGCLIWDNLKIDNSLIKFDTDPVLGLDTGGALHAVIEKYGLFSHFTLLDEVHVNNHLFNKSFYNFYSSIGNGHFMHFLNSSNWANAADDQERLNTLYMILEEKINIYR